MDASSTTMRSASAGTSWNSVPSARSGCWASIRWTVIAGRPVSSERRLAALPVGAASVTLPPIARTVAAMAATVWLLPQPGPPVSTDTVLVSTRLTAARWSSCSRWSSAKGRSRSVERAWKSLASWAASATSRLCSCLP